MTCKYDQDSLIDLLKRPASANPEKIEAMRLSELEEELWMG
ncbi:MAG: hypothetical protein U9N07_07030 [Euryarchaeota archaeon]|nr:hypothetical protein [Euryarchaeota archaeon]